MVYKKIPRKLKKRLKILTLKSHSESYIKLKRLTLKKIKILYYDSQREVFGVGRNIN